MPAILLRSDFNAEKLRVLAASSRDGDQVRRLLALALIYDGKSRVEAGRLVGMDRQILCDWVHRFNAGGPGALVNRTAPGAARRLTAEQEAAFMALVEAGPAAADLSALARWRCVDLAAQIKTRWSVSYHPRTVGKLLDRLGLSHITARPQHYNQDVEAMAAFKKIFAGKVADIRATLAPDTPIEIWFQDEMRVGQKTHRTRIWAKTGTRPRLVADLRTGCAYLFGAICPARDTGAALAMPHANTQAMQMHLDEISLTVAPGAHAILILDQAGWHTTGKLSLPANISLMPLPPRSPELNALLSEVEGPQENVWQYLRQRFLSNRIFDSYEAILTAVCDAWNTLLNETNRITSIGTRQWVTS